MMGTIKARRAILSIGLAVSLGAAALASPAALAQAWPARPVRVIVAAGAGGAADILARLMGERLTPVLGQPFIFDNRAGAGGHVGSEMVARSPADGYTLLMSGAPTHSAGPHLFKDLKYDPMRDVPPVAMLAAAPNLLVVNNSSPVKSVQELVKLARDKPGRLTYSSAGNGTSGHLAAELLKSMARIDVVHVPFKSGPEAVTGVLSNQVDFMFFTPPATLPLIKAGKLRALGISSSARSALAPETPTLAESGYPEFEVLAWYALFAPRGVPREIMSRLAGEIEKVLRQPDVKEKIIQLGAEPHFLAGEALLDFVTRDSAKAGKLIRDTGSKTD